jgi:hypothetical protein
MVIDSKRLTGQEAEGVNGVILMAALKHRRQQSGSSPIGGDHFSGSIRSLAS